MPNPRTARSRNPEGNDPKNQHYVPRFHLKQFAGPTSPTNDQRYIHVYDRFTGCHQPHHGIRSLTAEPDFYTLGESPSSRDPYRVERELARREQKQSIAVRRFLAGDATEADVPVLNDFVVLSVQRTAWHREHVRRAVTPELMLELALPIGRDLYLSGIDPKIQAAGFSTLRDYFDGNQDILQSQDALIEAQFAGKNAVNYLNAVSHRYMLVALGHPGFVSSDNPVIFRGTNTWDFRPLPEIGVLHAQEIWFPLTPCAAMVITKDGDTPTHKMQLSDQKLRAINTALAQHSLRYTFWQPGSTAGGLVRLPGPEKQHRKRRKVQRSGAQVRPGTQSRTENGGQR